MIKLVLASVLICASTSVLAQQNTRGYNNTTKNTPSTRTYPNYVAPKSDFKKCTPVVVNTVNVFTKQPQQEVRCY